MTRCSSAMVGGIRARQPGEGGVPARSGLQQFFSLRFTTILLIAQVFFTTILLIVVYNNFAHCSGVFYNNFAHCGIQQFPPLLRSGLQQFLSLLLRSGLQQFRSLLRCVYLFVFLLSVFRSSGRRRGLRPLLRSVCFVCLFFV